MAPIHWHSFFFLLFALATCVFSIAVAMSGNIVRMAFYLVIALGAVAGLFFLAGATFLGAMQLMVYVGGTMVLLAFGVMLTARGPLVSMGVGGGQWLMAALVAGSLSAVLLQTIVQIAPPAAEKAAVETIDPKSDHTTTRLGMGLLGVRTDQPAAAGTSPGYLLVFEIISVHLVVVLVGAAYLARAKRRSGEQGVGSREQGVGSRE